MRKKELESRGEIPYSDPQIIEMWKSYIKDSLPENLSDSDFEIQQTYKKLKASLPPRAETYLNQEAKKYLTGIKRPSTKSYKKIYEFRGVQVFLDEENIHYKSQTPYDVYIKKILNILIPNFLNYIKDILPNRKPKIVITDLDKNPYTQPKSDRSSPSAGMEFNKSIFIDWRYADDVRYYIHEYAHWVADLVPAQTSTILQNAFQEMLNTYFRATKRKKIESSEITDQMRNRIAKKLGFPDVYGLTNPDEFFAIVIEYWKELPNNAATYKFKTLVKRAITRL